jgi:CrcB protein
MPGILLVMIGGAVGAALRWETSRLALRRLGPGFPWGTLAVNLIGALLMGVLAARMIEAGTHRPLWLLLAVGLLGGFTTFSAFSLELFLMLQRGEATSAAGYAAASVLGSILLLAIGFWAVRAAA